jgi:hypothetical protein
LRIAMAEDNESETLTLDNLETVLAKDTKVKLAGIDIDGTRQPG